jgi:hypothetical protein
MCSAVPFLASAWQGMYCFTGEEHWGSLPWSCSYYIQIMTGGVLSPANAANQPCLSCVVWLLHMWQEKKHGGEGFNCAMRDAPIPWTPHRAHNHAKIYQGYDQFVMADCCQMEVAVLISLLYIPRVKAIVKSSRATLYPTNESNCKKF